MPKDPKTKTKPRLDLKDKALITGVVMSLIAGLCLLLIPSLVWSVMTYIIIALIGMSFPHMYNMRNATNLALVIDLLFLLAWALLQVQQN